MTRLRPFSRFARWASRKSGSGVAFLLACLTIVVWLVTGPAFGYSDTWQLVINTATTIVTFLMVFLIQNAQTRDAEALQVKVDELIRAIRPARNAMLDLEELPEEELRHIQASYEELAEAARRGRRTRARRRVAKREAARPPKSPP